MQYKSLHERWNDETASDFIVEKPKIKLEPIKPAKKKSKAQQVAKTFFQTIEKFNPYHGKDGRFTSSDSAASFTYKPGASTAHDKAIEREKEKHNQSSKGFKGTLYHGSPSTDIKEFDMKRAGQNTSSGEKLLFFTDSKQMADDFSYERLEGSSKYFQQRGKKGRVYEVDVEMKNPLDFRKLNDNDIDNILKLDIDGILTREEVQNYASKNHQLLKAGLELTADSLKSLGYDGLIANTGKAGHNSIEYAVVDSKQAKIKKSIAKTFKDVFKFNPYHDRLGRFASAGNYASFTYAPGKSKAHDNAIAREKERAAAAERKELGNKINNITSGYRKDAMAMMGVKYDKETMKQIDELYSETAMNDGFKIENGKVLAKKASHDRLKEVAKDIASRQEYEDNSTASEYKELQRYVKGTPLNISSQDKSNIADWNDYRKANFGNFTISNKGISVDSFYQEAANRYPHLFDKNVTNPADQLQKISSTLKDLRPKKVKVSGEELNQLTKDISDVLYEYYVTAYGMATGSRAA